MGLCAFVHSGRYGVIRRRGDYGSNREIFGGEHIESRDLDEMRAQLTSGV